uniref:Putative ovule protein n=1 Tax=Solanum chacoense TaxID=4108 RepID=A0A0V0HG99_SOLCH
MQVNIKCKNTATGAITTVKIVLEYSNVMSGGLYFTWTLTLSRSLTQTEQDFNKVTLMSSSRLLIVMTM